MDDQGFILNNENLVNSMLAVHEFDPAMDLIPPFDIPTENVRNGQVKAVNGTFNFN